MERALANVTGSKVCPEKLKRLVAQGASIRQICDELDVGYSTVRYWMQKEGLRTKRAERIEAFETARAEGRKRVTAHCFRHGESTFVLRGEWFRCLRCNSAAVASRRRKVKRILVEEAGGACFVCGYNRFLGALQFHHMDPAEKEFVVSRHGMTRSISEARAEAQKCVLLCANCHAEVEGGITTVAR